jgi:hypothetical protein
MCTLFESPEMALTLGVVGRMTKGGKPTYGGKEVALLCLCPVYAIIWRIFGMAKNRNVCTFVT